MCIYIYTYIISHNIYIYIFFIIFVSVFKRDSHYSHWSLIKHSHASRNWVPVGPGCSFRCDFWLPFASQKARIELTASNCTMRDYILIEDTTIARYEYCFFCRGFEYFWIFWGFFCIYNVWPILELQSSSILTVHCRVFGPQYASSTSCRQTAWWMGCSKRSSNELFELKDGTGLASAEQGPDRCSRSSALL